MKDSHRGMNTSIDFQLKISLQIMTHILRSMPSNSKLSSLLSSCNLSGFSSNPIEPISALKQVSKKCQLHNFLVSILAFNIEYFYLPF